MRYLVAPFVALVFLVGMPFVFPAPESDPGTLGAIALALVLVAVAVRGVVHFVRSRKPKTYLDSIMPEKELPPKVTIMEKPKE